MTISTPAPIIIYEAAGQAVEVRLDAQHDTVWLTQEKKRARTPEHYAKNA